MGRPVVHFEIGCRDRGKTGEFYSRLFDWQMQENGPATMVSTGGKEAIGGHLTALGHEPFHYTMFYVQVDDVQASLDKATSLGAKTLVGPIDIPDGSFAWFADPDGNTIGLWKPKA
jgi:predicted enzyme related to lactoylglutathione lyase